MKAKYAVLPLVKNGRTRGYVLVERIPAFYVRIARSTGLRKARKVARAASRGQMEGLPLVQALWGPGDYQVGRRAVTMLAKGRL